MIYQMQRVEKRELGSTEETVRRDLRRGNLKTTAPTEERIPMYKALLHDLDHTPEPYESTGLAFWDDPHISSQMLAAHLDPETDSASRNHDFIETSADWIASLAEGAAGRKLLDLGCGPGLYAECLHDRGFTVRGIDLSQSSITYARRRAEGSGRSIEYLRGDYTQVDFGSGYDIVILIFCDFGVLPPADKMTMLGKAKDSLAPGGALVLDCFTPENYRGFVQNRTIDYEHRGFWRDEPYACIKTDIPYATSGDYLERYIVVTQDSHACYNLWNHAFTADELTGMLHETGFGDIAFYADASGRARSAEDTVLCVCAR